MLPSSYQTTDAQGMTQIGTFIFGLIQVILQVHTLITLNLIALLYLVVLLRIAHKLLFLVMSQNGNQMTTCFHPPSNLVVFFNAQSEQNYVLPITIGSNGTSVTLGSTNQDLGIGGYGTKGTPVQAVYDEDSEWIVMMMLDNQTRPRLTAVKPSGSGASASISVGTSNQIFNDTVKYPTLYYDKSQNKIVAGYTDDLPKQ